MPPLTFTLIQSDLKWEDPNANRDYLEQKINSIKEKTEVVVLPEMFSTGFSMQPEKLAESMDGDTIHWMKRIAAERKVIVSGSFICKDTDGKENKYFNRLVWMLPNGQCGTYDKRHLFAYAGEHERFTPGTKRLIASVKGWKINLMVCYDLRFPVWARQSVKFPDNGPAETEYDVLVYVANWPDKRRHAWKTLLQARAIENQSYVIGVNRVGNDGNKIHYEGESLVIDPLGTILYQGGNAEELFTITLDKEHLNKVREKFPFWKDADQFKIFHEDDE